MNKMLPLSRGIIAYKRRGGAFVLTLLFLTLVSVLFPGLSLAQVPEFINYQSRLLDSGGAAVTASTTFTFAIYNDVSAGIATSTPSAAGPLLWTATYDQASGSCAAIVPDSDGYFNIQLGSCVSFPDYLQFITSPLYLGVTIGTDPEASPRAQLGTTPFAQTAAKVIGEEQSAFGTTTPQADAVVTITPNATSSIALFM